MDFHNKDTIQGVYCVSTAIMSRQYVDAEM